MEIKEGMYVRNNNGIAKYLGLGINVLKDDGSRSFNHWKSKHIFDNYIFDEEYGDTLTSLDSIDKKITSKPSYDIIDLIEVGDYVNGYKVIDVGIEEEGYKYIDIDFDRNCDELHWGEYSSLQNMDIKSILTKEQFDSMKYEL